MKKFIITSGVILVNLFVLGAIFKVQQWPGANILITTGLGLFSFILLPIAFIFIFKSNGNQQKALYIAGFICAFVVFTGALFKIMHWPGASFFLYIGVPLPFLYFLPTYMYFYNKSKDKSVVNFTGVMLMMVYIAAFTAMLGININSKAINDLTYIGNNIQVTNLILEKRNHLTNDTEKMPNKKNNALKEATYNLLSEIFKIKIELVETVEGKDAPAINNEFVDTEMLLLPEETFKTNLLMRGHDGISGKATDIKIKLAHYSGIIDSLNLTYNKNAVLNLLSTEPIEINNPNLFNEMLWEDVYFPYNQNQIAAINQMSLIETRINMAYSLIASLW